MAHVPRRSLVTLGFIGLAAALTPACLGNSESSAEPIESTAEQSECGGFSLSETAANECVPRNVNWSYDSATQQLTLIETQIPLTCGQSVTPRLFRSASSYTLELEVGQDPGANCRCPYDVKLTATLDDGPGIALVVDGKRFDLDFSEAQGTLALPPNLSAECQAGGGCGDAAVMARHAACVSSTDEQSCVSQGGRWVRAGTYCVECDTEAMVCRCPTGDESCWCTSSDDCVDGCYWRPNDPEAWSDLSVCESEGKGVCGSWPGGSAVFVENGSCSMGVE